MEYGSTPYIGMAPKKMAAPFCMCTKWDVQTSALDLAKSFCGPYLSFSNVFYSNKTVNADREVPNRQVAKPANRLSSSFFREDSTTMTEAITMIQTRRSATGSGLLHPHHSALKQIKPFSSDSQALEASTCRYTPFCSIPFCVLNGGYAYTGTPEMQPRGASCSA